MPLSDGATTSRVRAVHAGQSKNIFSTVPALLMLAIGLFAYAFRVTDYFSAVPGDMGDARFNSVILEHVYQWLTGTATSLWSPQFFYPAPGVLAFSDNHFGSAVFYSIFRCAGLDREHAFMAWFVCGLVLNYISAYGALRWLGLSATGSAMGAFVFAFAPAAMMREGHAQLTYRLCVPIAFAATIKLVMDSRPALLALIAAMVAWQFYISIYLGVFLVYLLISTFVASVLSGQGFFRQRLQSLWTTIAKMPLRSRVLTASVMMLSGLSIAVLLQRYRVIGKHYGLMNRSIDELLTMLPRPQSYLMTRNKEATWIGEYLPAVPMAHEHLMFVGFAALTLGLIGWFSARTIREKELTRTAAIGLLFLVVSTLSIYGHSIYQIIANLPGVVAVRAVSRIILVMLMPISLLAAFGAQAAVGWMSKLAFGPAPGIALLASLFALETAQEPIANTRASQWQQRQQDLQLLWDRQSKPAKPVLLATGRPGEARYLIDLDAMIFAQDRHIASLNGYSGNVVPGYSTMDRCDPSAALMDSYERHGGVPDIAARSPEIMRSLVRLALAPCPEPALLESMPKELSSAQISAIRLDAIALEALPSGVVNARVTVQSSTPVDRMMKGGHVLFASWRIVSRSTQADLNEGWTTRQELGSPLIPGQPVVLELSSIRPSSSQPQVLQVTLVEEGVQWLHNGGMKVLAIDLPTP